MLGLDRFGIRPDFAPHTELGAASFAQNYSVESKQVWVELEKLKKNNPSPTDLEWCKKALEDVTVRNETPALLPSDSDKKVMNSFQSELEAIIAKSKLTPTTIQTEASENNISPELLKRARNAFEEFLLSEGFDSDKIASSEEVDLEAKRSFALTVFLKRIRGADFPNMVTGAFKNFSFTSRIANGSFNALQLVETSGGNIPLGADRDRIIQIIGEPGKGKLSTDVQIIEEIFDIFADLRKPLEKDVVVQQSVDALSGVYVKLRTLNMLDVGRIGAWANLPRLYKDDLITLEKESLGTVFFAAFQEIMRSGREWGYVLSANNKPKWAYPKMTSQEVKVDDKSGKNLMVFDGTSTNGIKNRLKVWVEMARTYFTRTDEESLFPEWDAGGNSDVKPEAIDRLRIVCARAAKQGVDIFRAEAGVGTTAYAGKITQERSIAGDAATLLAYHLAVITGEADFQDNKKGSPVGRNILARMLQAISYTLKTNTVNSSSSKTNPYTAGRMSAYFRTFWKFINTDDGKTAEQAIMLGESWEDISLSESKPQLTAAWCDSILQAIGEYNRNENGLRAGQIFKIAEINFQEGRVTINQEMMKQIQDMFRFSWNYFIERDNSPGDVVKSWQEKSKEFSKRKRMFQLPTSQPQLPPKELEISPKLSMPSEEFALYTVVDHEGNIVYEKDDNPYISRIGKIIYADPLRLGFWVDAKEEVMSSGPAETKGKGYSSARLVKHKVLDDNGVETGQQYDEIIITLKKGVDVTKNKPSILVRRLLYQYNLDMICMPGDTIARLEKKDWVALGMAVSPQIRHRYMEGHYAGLLKLFGAKIGDKLGAELGKAGKILEEYLRREDPGFIPFDEETYSSEEAFLKWLSQAGHIMSREDTEGLRVALGGIVGIDVKPVAGTKH